MTAAAALRRPPPDPRLLPRCLLLAVLLHVWLVLMFGNTTGITQPGQSGWGSLSVRLRGHSGATTDAPPGAAPQPPSRHTGGQPTSRARPDAPTAPSTATLNLPDGFKPVERQMPGMPGQAAEAQPLPPAQLPAPVSRLEAPTDASASSLPRPDSLRAAATAATLPAPPSDLPAPVLRLEADAATPAPPALPRPAELRMNAAAPVTAPAPAELPAPVRRLDAPSSDAVARLQRPVELQAPAAAKALPATPAGGEPPAAVRRLEAPATAAAAVLPRARELRPAPAAATATAAPDSPALPAPVRRLEAAESGSSIAPLQAVRDAHAATPAAAPQAMPALDPALPAQVAGPALGDPAAPALPGPQAAAGPPGDGLRSGPDLPNPPTSAASAPRAPLNLSLPRGDMTARKSPGLVELLPPPPERKSKLEQSIDEAANKDCRKAYGGLGLLAVVPLAVDAARGKGCKW